MIDRIIFSHLIRKISAEELPDSKLSDFQQVGNQAGSQPGGFFKHKETGEDFYIKRPRTENHAKNELLGAKLYELAGVRVPETSLIHLDTNDLSGSSRVGLMSKIVPNLKKIRGKSPRDVQGVLDHFAVDAWVSNWDVVGLDFDNLLHDDKGAVRVDQGGVLLYRAQGEPKGHLFGDEAMEIDSLRQHHINPNSASVFGKLSEDDLFKGIQKVLNIPNEKITETVMRFGPGTEQEKAELAKKLISRKEHLREVASELGHGEISKSGSAYRIFVATQLGIGKR